MKIGIFSKMANRGGSTNRCLEMARELSKHEEVYLIGRGKTPNISLPANIHRIDNELDGGKNSGIFYELDTLLIVNSDSQYTGTLNYWRGKTKCHKFDIDLKRIKQMIFLFNYALPNKSLNDIYQECSKIKIITANADMCIYAQSIAPNILTTQLNSPIAPNTKTKTISSKIRIGMHSVNQGDKFNSEIEELVLKLNEVYASQIYWDFMGIPNNKCSRIKQLSNVKIRNAFSIPVYDYLSEIDIFSFYISWTRKEPWSRALAEAMMSGCPIVATPNGGNKDQVRDFRNGFLCHTLNDFVSSLILLIKHQELRESFAIRSQLFSEDFTSAKVIEKFLKFLKR